MKNSENIEEIGAKTRILAFFCKICPFCIAARKFPDSAYARAMKKAEADCPACKAYAQLKDVISP